MYGLQKAKRLEDGVWVEGSLKKQLDGELVKQNTICSFIGMVDRNGEKIWEHDLVKDRYGSVFLVCWNPLQYAYYGIFLKQKNGKQGQGCFRMGAFRSLDLERMSSILDQENVEGRWIAYFSRLVFYERLRKKLF